MFFTLDNVLVWVAVVWTATPTIKASTPASCHGVLRRTAAAAPAVDGGGWRKHPPDVLHVCVCGPVGGEKEGIVDKREDDWVTTLRLRESTHTAGASHPAHSQSATPTYWQ